MKSAYELAIERTGGQLNQVSESNKAKLAEIDSICKAKLAEIDIVYKDKFKNTSDPAAIEQLKEDMAVEIASIRSKTERDKQEIRQS
jgi:hypothetical protein